MLCVKKSIIQVKQSSLDPGFRERCHFDISIVIRNVWDNETRFSNFCWHNGIEYSKRLEQWSSIIQLQLGQRDWFFETFGITILSSERQPDPLGLPRLTNMHRFTLWFRWGIHRSVLLCLKMFGQKRDDVDEGTMCLVAGKHRWHVVAWRNPTSFTKKTCWNPTRRPWEIVGGIYIWAGQAVVVPRNFLVYR